MPINKGKKRYTLKMEKWYASVTFKKMCYEKGFLMDKYKVILNIINDTWNVIKKYKDEDVSQDKECEQILAELQEVCDKYRLKIGEDEGVLARKVAALFLEYLCKEEEC